MPSGWLAKLSPWDATWFACEWGSSTEAWQRLAIARELAANPLAIVGGSFVLDVLGDDVDPDVQTFARAGLEKQQELQSRRRV